MIGGGVRLKLEMDPSRVLLSDFDAWHHVLNRMHLPLTIAEHYEYEAQWNAREIMARGKSAGLKPYEYARIVEGEFKAQIETSWPRCFNLAAMQVLMEEDDYGSKDHEPYTQAVFEEIRLQDVVQVTPFNQER